MKRSVQSFLLCVMMLGVPSVSGQTSLDLPDLVDQVRPSIVVVIAFDALGNRLGTATGFFISDNRFITARHAIVEAAHAMVIFHDGTKFRVNHLLAEDTIGDLVLLELSDHEREITPLTISDEIPRVGQDIFVVGGPLGFDQTVTRGIISGRIMEPFAIPMLQINAAISYGSSGSPVMNMNGEVVGIAVAKIPEGENLNIAIPAERLSHLVQNPMSLAQWAGLQIERQVHDEPRRALERTGIKPMFPLKVPPAVQGAYSAVTTVRVKNEAGRILHEADAFFVLPSRLLCPRELLFGVDRVMVETSDGKTFEIENIAADDPMGGFVLLEVPEDVQVPSTLEMDWRRPYREEPLFIVPFGARDEADITQHRVITTLTELPGFGPTLSVGPLDRLDRSGSPVVSVNGRLIALVMQRKMDGFTLTYLIPVDRIRDFLFSSVEPLRTWNKRIKSSQEALVTNVIWKALPFVLTEHWEIASTILEYEVTDEMDDVDQWLAIALCLSFQDEWQATIVAANHALTLDPESSLACFLQGMGFIGQRTRAPVVALNQARDALRKAIDLNDSYNYHGYLRFAAILADFGDLEQAINVMNKAITLWPKRPETHHMMASLYMRNSSKLLNNHEFGLGDQFRKRSVRSAAKAINLAPYASWAFRQLSQSAALNETNEVALDAARKAVSLAPD
ncbi:MAG: trypsin-like peptidase domain-containing protein, partial [Planctomycetota bacterium]|nr:trypsin-like peptidase domain-containing protein [Planctomycetota bacterium]